VSYWQKELQSNPEKPVYQSIAKFVIARYEAIQWKTSAIITLFYWHYLRRGQRMGCQKFEVFCSKTRSTNSPAKTLIFL